MSEETLRNQPILVTGVHRSGTTWVGKILCASGEAAYISEPLNLWHRPGVMKVPVSGWYTYITQENESAYLPAFDDIFSYRYHLWAEIQSLKSWHDFLRMLRDCNIFFWGKLLNKRPLLKDPFAAFSIPWFMKRLNCRVVVMVRHPLAFVSSLKRLGWNFNFFDLLEQPLLMRDCLAPYRQEILSVHQKTDDIIAQGSLLWKLIYQTAYDCQNQHPEVIFARHEDLSRQPFEEFHRLYDELGLHFNSKVEKAILETSSSENPKELSQNKVHAVRLDSRSNLDNWKRRLTEDEIERITQLTGEAASRFYPEAEWQ
ncbi:MAG: sulfotransferase [Chloroflexi bacterium]|nr:sulfotransferase [Chloroflexota bacterium]